MSKVKILLIEDNRLLREGITTLLTKFSNFEVVAWFGDGDAIPHLKSDNTPPDIVLLDLGLVKAVRRKLMENIQERWPTSKVIAMDIIHDHIDILEFVKAGGSGFILKNAPIGDYIKTIKEVNKGRKVLPPLMTQPLFTQIIEAELESGRNIDEDSLKLTYREREVVGLIAEGLGNKEIAQRLYIATDTVKSHVHNILEKLDLSTRLQIAIFAKKNRI